MKFAELQEIVWSRGTVFLQGCNQLKKQWLAQVQKTVARRLHQRKRALRRGQEEISKGCSSGMTF